MSKYLIKTKIYRKYKSRYIRISKNQLRVLESLYKDGGLKSYEHKNQLKYSEHSGLLDFGKSKLEKIIVSTKKNYSDKFDKDILLPENMVEAIDYEYMFHTHPNTNGYGGRVNQGILYEFPSISDLFHFIYHYNKGITQGSIIISPEGLYIIKSVNNNKIIIKDENKIIKYLENELLEIQEKAIIHFQRIKINETNFYKFISKNNNYINLYNELIKKYNLKILYYPRKYYKGKWILDDIYIKVSPIE